MTAPRLVGVDVGGTKCLAVVVEDGMVVAEHRLPTPASTPELLDAIAKTVDAVRDGAEGRDLRVGIGVPGLVDRDGVLQFTPNLPGVNRVAVRADMSRRFPGAGITVDNDANCAAWGERLLGAARDHDHAVVVTLGTGIGGGIVAGGQLFRGANGMAGEIGHMVVDANGPRCPCGQRGCWERFASGSGLGRLAREAAHAGRAPRVLELAGGDAEAVRGEHVTAAAAEGDPGASDVVAEFAWWLALGMANLANVFDPGVVVLGGGLIEAGEVLLRPVREAFHRQVEADEFRPDIEIRAALLGEHAGAIGAALLPPK